jgi:hypothetical protein
MQSWEDLIGTLIIQAVLTTLFSVSYAIAVRSSRSAKLR